MMKLNCRQRDALADALDKIGVAAAIAMVVGLFVNEALTLVNTVFLAVFAIVLLVFAVLLRGGER